MKHRHPLFLATVLLATGVEAAALKPLPPRGTFLYSDLCWASDENGGDAGGYQVRLERSATGDTLWLEWSEGPLMGPMQATKLRIDPVTSEISFTIPGNTAPSFMPGDETYAGWISTRTLYINGDAVPRVKRLWHDGDKPMVCQQ